MLMTQHSLTRSRLDVLRKKAERGDLRALASLAYMYRYGKGVREDKTKALKYNLSAASLGDAEAAFNTGDMHDMAEGVRRNRPRALRFYEQAAELGHPDALASVGAMYWDGEE